MITRQKKVSTCSVHPTQPELTEELGLVDVKTLRRTFEPSVTAVSGSELAGDPVLPPVDTDTVRRKLHALMGNGDGADKPSLLPHAQAVDPEVIRRKLQALYESESSGAAPTDPNPSLLHVDPWKLKSLYAEVDPVSPSLNERTPSRPTMGLNNSLQTGGGGKVVVMPPSPVEVKVDNSSLERDRQLQLLQQQQHLERKLEELEGKSAAVKQLERLFTNPRAEVRGHQWRDFVDDYDNGYGDGDNDDDDDDDDYQCARLCV